MWGGLRDDPGAPLGRPAGLIMNDDIAHEGAGLWHHDVWREPRDDLAPLAGRNKWADDRVRGDRDGDAKNDDWPDDQKFAATSTTSRRAMAR